MPVAGPERPLTRVEAEAEAILCGLNPRHFLGYVTILDQADGVIPFEPWPHLLDLLDTFETHRLLVVLKARQLGVSWLVAAYVLWLAKFQQGANVLLLSQGEMEATKLLRKARHIEDHLPTWLQWDRGKDSDSELMFPHVQSALTALPATRKAGRSEGATLVVPDEWAFHEHGAENMTALLPTVGDKGRMIVVSTANGMAGHFYDLWHDAEARGFYRVFIPWHARPDRDAAWYARAKAADRDGYQQEYPATAEEAFLQSGRPVFPGVSLTPAPALATPDSLPPATIVYRHPRKVGGRYAIGADPAEGLAHGDRSCAVVVELDPITGEGTEAAHLCGQFEPSLFAAMLDALARHYRGAVLAVERNNHGHAVLAELRRRELPEYVLYRERPPLKGPTARTTPALRGRVGWHTNTASKPPMIAGLATALRPATDLDNDGETVTLGPPLLTIHTPDLLTELRAYQRDDDGDTAAPNGRHDDRVIALAIAWAVREEVAVRAGYRRGSVRIAGLPGHESSPTPLPQRPRTTRQPAIRWGGA